MKTKRTRRDGIKATSFRRDLFRILDRAARTGKPVEIESKGRRFKIIPVKPQDRFASLDKHPDVFSGDLDNLITIDWMTERRP